MEGLDLGLAITRAGGDAGFTGRGRLTGTSSRVLAKLPQGIYVTGTKYS